MAAADPELRIERLEAALRMASRELQWANLTIQKKDAEIQLLQERLRKQRIGFLGPGSETLSDLQLELLADDEPGVTRTEVEAESRREPIPAVAPRAQASSGPDAFTRESAACRRSNRLPSQLQALRRGNAGDRIRHQ